MADAQLYTIADLLTNQKYVSDSVKGKIVEAEKLEREIFEDADAYLVTIDPGYNRPLVKRTIAVASTF